MDTSVSASRGSDSSPWVPAPTGTDGKYHWDVDVDGVARGSFRSGNSQQPLVFGIPSLAIGMDDSGPLASGYGFSIRSSVGGGPSPTNTACSRGSCRTVRTHTFLCAPDPKSSKYFPGATDPGGQWRSRSLATLLRVIQRPSRMTRNT